MINIAIVDDDLSSINLLTESFKRYFSENEGTYSIDVYADPVKFYDEFSSQYDVITLDIQMPSMDGLTLARKIRTVNSVVIIIFITDHASCAISGYEVGALDFMAKPIRYYDFSLKMRRALAKYALSNKCDNVIIKTSDGMVRMRQRDIIYVEVSGHSIIYHTSDSEYNYYGTLKDVEKLLDPDSFCRCNSCYLVNLFHVEKVEQLFCVVGGYRLKISQPKRAAFVNKLGKYYATRRS